MRKAYLDNASTTALRPEVITEITQVLAENYGNPSSTHSFGRSAKVIVESSRKTIASLIGAEAREIIFTSCGTEANNWIISSAVRDLGVKRIISSRVEHHSVLHSVIEAGTTVDYVNLLPDGSIDFNHLVTLLSSCEPALVTLMHVNNETGAVLDLEKAGRICRQHNAYFHTDTVQSIGKTAFDFKNLPIDFATASAHKFHGPKGAGFAFVRKNTPLKPILHGGEQEKGLRAGTEAVHQIAGMAKALELSYHYLEAEKEYITSLRDYCIAKLQENFPGFSINGCSDSEESGFYNIINVMLPMPQEKTSMILFHLDMLGIAVSRGSACQSGSVKPSHVLREILSDDDIRKPSLRISFSHYNTKEDVDQLISALKTI